MHKFLSMTCQIVPVGRSLNYWKKHRKLKISSHLKPPIRYQNKLSVIVDRNETKSNSICQEIGQPGGGGGGGGVIFLNISENKSEFKSTYLDSVTLYYKS